MKTQKQISTVKKLMLWLLTFAVFTFCLLCTLIFMRFNSKSPPAEEVFLQKTLTESRPCPEEETFELIVDTLVIQTENTTAPYETTVPLTESASPPETFPPPETIPVQPSKEVCLNVKNILQNPELPNGCEAVSLAILLEYAGYKISPVKLYDNYMPKSPLRQGDPYKSYVGDAKGEGYGCYAPCAVITGNAFLTHIGSDKQVIDVSGRDMAYYESLLEQGIPVMIWGTVDMNCNGRLCWEDIIDGKYVSWLSYSHCLVLVGFTEHTYIFCDPLKGKTVYAKNDVMTSFLLNRSQACMIK